MSKFATLVKHPLLPILLIAVFFRLFILSATPPGLYPDIAVNGTDAIHANESGNYAVFYPANNGREGLFMNLIAFSFKVFGVNVTAIRLVSALIGIFTVLGVYLLAYQFFERRVAFLSALFMATSFWHVNFSRMGFRAIMLPFILVWTVYFLHKAITTRRWLPLITSAIFFGLGFHTYIAVRISPLLIVAYIICAALAMQGKIINRFTTYFKKNFIRYAVFGIITLLILTPLLLYFKANPEDSGTRTSQVSIFSKEVNKGDLPGTALKVVGKYALMFNVAGDKNWRHNFSGFPQLNPLVGVFFLIGIGLSIVAIKNKQYFYLFFIAWIAIMILPGVLTEEGAPHALRTIGILPAPYILAAVGAVKLYEYMGKFKSYIGYVALTLIILFDFSLYFLFWGRTKAVYGEFTQSLVNIGEYFNASPSEAHNFALVNTGGVIYEGVPVAAQTVKFITYKKAQVSYLNPSDVDSIYLLPGDKLAFLAPPETSLIQKLESKYKGVFRTIDLLPGTDSDFTIFEVQ